MIYWACYCLASFLNVIYFNCKFIGREHLPSQGSYIIASNHLSNLDPFVIGIVRATRFNFLAKEELFKKKILAWLFRGMGAFPIKRDTSDFRALREALKRLKSGAPLILFPEGTRGVGTRKKQAQPGVGFIATKAKVPVIPAYIEGSDKALPSGSKWFKRHQVTIRFGPPIHFKKDQSYQGIADQIMKKIGEISQ